MSGVTTSSLSLARSLRNWVILDYEEVVSLTISPWAPFFSLSFLNLVLRDGIVMKGIPSPCIGWWTKRRDKDRFTINHASIKYLAARKDKRFAREVEGWPCTRESEAVFNRQSWAFQHSFLLASLSGNEQPGNERKQDPWFNSWVPLLTLGTGSGTQGRLIK